VKYAIILKFESSILVLCHHFKMFYAKAGMLYKRIAGTHSFVNFEALYAMNPPDAIWSK